jgi:hypothetical protein
MEPVYANRDRKIVAGIGDVVMAPGNLRGIVIGISGTFIKVIVIASKKETGDTVVLTPRFISEFSARDCLYLEKQTLNP